jgi:hypothetical protein
MLFHSETFNFNDVSGQESYGILKNNKTLLFGFIGISLVAIAFLSITQSIGTSGKISRFTQERHCECDIGCLCGTHCICRKNNLK